MAKRKKTIIAGRIRKTVIYTAPEPQDSPRVRAAKSKATSAAQKAMNDKTARGRLELLLACNFTGKDLFLTLLQYNCRVKHVNQACFIRSQASATMRA